MPLPITKYTDYQAGVYKLPLTDHTVSELTSFIGTYEKIYLEDLLGCELAALFIANLDGDGIPVDPIYKTLYDSFCNDNACEFQRSLGMVIMIKGFIFWEYGKTLTVSLGSVGATQSDGENTVSAKQSATKLIPNYNRSIGTYSAIQQYICENRDVYPTFKGRIKEFTGFL